MPTGIVKWFNDEKGFGFIVQDTGGADLFVHKSSIQSGRLKENDAVYFEVGEGKKGPCATDVSLA